MLSAGGSWSDRAAVGRLAAVVVGGFGSGRYEVPVEFGMEGRWTGKLLIAEEDTASTVAVPVGVDVTR